MKYRVFGIALAAAAAFSSANADDLSREEVKALALEAILENPEIIMEAVRLLDEKRADASAAQLSSTLEGQRDLLENDPNAPVLGNPDGDVTIVEFFDYNCPYCRQVKPEIQLILENDPGVRLVYREWPILGEGSVFAAKAALASREQGKYEEFHWAMMGLRGRAEEASVLRIAEDIGLDIGKLRADMEAPDVDAHIAVSMRLTEALGFSGTPSFVIGNALVPGFVKANVLGTAVAQARAEAEPDE